MADITGMLQAAAGNAGEDVDPFFQDTVLLLHGDGTNGAQNNTFLDSSTNNFTITRAGNTTQGSFSPFSKPDGRWGALTSDRAFITIPASSDFDLINTDFTVEFWWNPVAFNTMAFSGNVLFGNGLATANHGWATEFGGSGTTVTSVSFFTWASGARTNNVFTVSIPFGTWVHVAFVRSGSSAGNLKCYVNGVQQGAAQNAATYSTAGSTFVLGSGGYRQNPQYSGNAAYYISNVRLTKSAIYTTAFTPSTSPLTAISGTTLLILQSNRFINNGTNSGAITSSSDSVVLTRVTPFSPFPITTEYSPSVNGGSGYFDGSGDYLTLDGGTPLTFGTGDFTIECWIYRTEASQRYLCDFRPNGSEPSNPWIVVDSNGTQRFGIGGSTLLTSSTTVPLNTWAHVAFVKNSGTVKIYIDGVERGSQASATSLSVGSNRPVIGAQGSSTGSNAFPGYISNFRVVKGTAVYTSAFTPPTAPLTAIANTSLLCNFTNAGIFDNTGFNNLETVGNAQIDTTIKKYGTGSIEFDGTGDFLQLPVSENLAFGTGNYTVELWVYFTSISAGTLQILYGSGDTGNSFFLSVDADQLSVGTFTAFVSNQATTFTTGVWYHVAACRSGTTLKLFQDGVQVGSDATDTTSWISNNFARIGANPSGTQAVSGYIDDLRITKGIARYTAAFTPPTKAFPNVGS